MSERRLGNPILSDNDRRALADLHSCLSVVRDRVRGVALGHHTGFYLFGRPGTGKTYNIRRTLEQDGVKYYYHHGHLTPMGLFELLEEHPDCIIVLDDVAEILNQRIAVQILLAALGSQPGETGVRIVKYQQAGTRRDRTLHRRDYSDFQLGTPRRSPAECLEKPNPLPEVQSRRCANLCPDAGHRFTRLACW